MLLSVKELHQEMNFGDVHKQKPKKFDHLILGPAAGEGLPDRLQCRGYNCHPSDIIISCSSCECASLALLKQRVT